MAIITWQPFRATVVSNQVYGAGKAVSNYDMPLRPVARESSEKKNESKKRQESVVAFLKDNDEPVSARF